MVQVKLAVAKPSFHIKVLVWVLAALFLMRIPANALRKAKEDSPSTCSFTGHVGSQDAGVLATAFGLVSLGSYQQTFVSLFVALLCMCALLSPSPSSLSLHHSFK